MANPYVSIVVLTLGYPAKVMEDLKKQTFKDFEVIFAQEKGIVPAMNAAVKKAKGKIFVRIDDDVELPERWLEELIKPFEDLLVAGATGPTFVHKELRKNRDSIRWAERPKGILKWLYDGNDFKPGGIRRCGVVSYDSNYQERFEGLSGRRMYEPNHLEGTNWAVRTFLIKEVGGFDPKFDGVAEWFDDDVIFKIKSMGYFLSYNPKAYLYHNLGKGGHYSDRFEGFGRVKNFLRFHWRHCRWRFFNLKFWVYLIIWSGYFVWKQFPKSR